MYMEVNLITTNDDRGRTRVARSKPELERIGFTVKLHYLPEDLDPMISFPDVIKKINLDNSDKDFYIYAEDDVILRPELTLKYIEDKIKHNKNFTAILSLGSHNFGRERILTDDMAEMDRLYDLQFLIVFKEGQELIENIKVEVGQNRYIENKGKKTIRTVIPFKTTQDNLKGSRIKTFKIEEERLMERYERKMLEKVNPDCGDLQQQFRDSISDMQQISWQNREDIEWLKSNGSSVGPQVLKDIADNRDRSILNQEAIEELKENGVGGGATPEQIDEIKGEIKDLEGIVLNNRTRHDTVDIRFDQVGENRATDNMYYSGMIYTTNQKIDELEKNISSGGSVGTVEELRGKVGVSGDSITLLGYYEIGDKPPLIYTYREGYRQDDGGHIIKSSIASGTWVAEFESEVDIRHFGARDNLVEDSHEQIQKVIDFCYHNKMKVIIPSGTYLVTRSIFVPSGMTIEGVGRVNSIIRTPFRKKASLYSAGSGEKAKAVIAEANVEKSKGKMNTVTTNFEKKFDFVNWHNRFYIGGGIEGYYDGDRDTNVNHPIYYPKNSAGWSAWNDERTEIEQKGSWIGLTGRENYGLGLLKSTDNPDLRWPSNQGIMKGTRVHSGTRNVLIKNLQIQTNTSDRGKDSGINFMYDASKLKGNLAQYDSSCLGIKIDSCWLYEIGGDGFSITRSVDTTIINTIAQRCANTGFKIEGVTSTNIIGCYANGCLEYGYNFKGVHYSQLSGCAADSCSRAYNFDNCSTIALLGCGAEASKALLNSNLAEEGGNLYFPGRSFTIKNSQGITLVNPYASTTREQVNDNYDYDEETNPNTTRHMRIESSQDISIIGPNFKSYRRWRTAPFRDSSNAQVPSAGRYWEFQDRLVDSVYEIRGENNSVSVQSNQSRFELNVGNQDRTPNVDLYDPGTVPNPLGDDTAGKTISGRDGNGGWIDVDGKTITIRSMEPRYPMKNKVGDRDKYWDWRRSLEIVRIDSDSVNTATPGVSGYISDKLPLPIDWNNMPEGQKLKYIIPRESSTSFIDGESKYYNYADFEVLSGDTGQTYWPMPINGVVNGRTTVEHNDGMRTIYNGGNLTDRHVASSAHGYIGNLKPSADGGYYNPIMALKVPMDRREMADETQDMPLQVFVDSNNYPLFKVYGTEKGVIGRAAGVDNKRMLSFATSDRAKITKLKSGATNTQIENRINNIIDRLRSHGLIIDGD